MKRPKELPKEDYQTVKQIARVLSPCVTQLTPPLPGTPLTRVHSWRAAEGTMFFSPWQFSIASPIDQVCLRGQIAMEDMAMACDLAFCRNPNTKLFQYISGIGSDAKGACFIRVSEPEKEEPVITVVSYNTSPAYGINYGVAHDLACRSFAFLIYRVMVDNLVSGSYVRSLLGFLQETEKGKK